MKRPILLSDHFTIGKLLRFTVLNNGLVSALISTNRTMVCETLAVLLLPALFGVNGVWFAIIFAECTALVLTVTMLVRNGNDMGTSGRDVS